MGKLEGALTASGLRLGIVVSRFNSFITERLLEGALNTFTRHGGKLEDVDVVHVPGAFELPLTVKRLAARGGYDALVALGAVVRGETTHHEYVASAATTGLSTVALEAGLPVAFGLLTTDTVEQAISRAGAKSGNKGAEAVLTAIEMANLLRELGE